MICVQSFTQLLKISRMNNYSLNHRPSTSAHILGRRLLTCLLVGVCVSLLVCPENVTAAIDEKDYYKLLGVPKDASDKTIKKAFRKLAIKYHPDKNPDPSAREEFEKIANGEFFLFITVIA